LDAALAALALDAAAGAGVFEDLLAAALFPLFELELVLADFESAPLDLRRTLAATIPGKPYRRTKPLLSA
jgi:hypothetical protein